MKVWRVFLTLKDKGNPPYTEEYIRLELQKHFDKTSFDAEWVVEGVRELVPESVPLEPKEHIKRSEEL